MNSTLFDALPVLPSSNLERSLAFSAHLGFATIMRAERYAIVRRDAAEIHFTNAPEGAAPGSGMCCLLAASTEALYREFSARGLTLDAPVEAQWNVKELSVFDPDGNLIRFAESIDDRVLQFEARR